jgi:hypothetical protein
MIDHTFYCGKGNANCYLGADYFVHKGVRSQRWTQHVECMGEMRNLCNILFVKPEGKRSLGDLGTEGKRILKWILNK